MEAISGLIQRRGLSALFIFLFSFALFSPSLLNDFVWDDVEVITKSQASFETSNILNVIVPPEDENKKARYYRPVVYVSTVSDQAAWGVSPFGHHLSNLIFFSVSAVLFYFMALSILAGFRKEYAASAAFVSSLLFIVHPIHVESVSWVAGRTDVLCGLFFFLAVLCHVQSQRRAWILVFTAISFTLALMSKEIAVSFIAVTLVYDLLSRRLLSSGTLVRYFVYVAILAIYFYLRGRAFVNIPEVSDAVIGDAAGEVSKPAGQKGPVSQTGIYLEAIKIVLNSTFVYVSKLIFPYNLNAFITTVPKELYYSIASAFIAFIALAITIWSAVRRENVVAFSLLWIPITLSPSLVVALYPIASTPMAERYLFIPSAGFCLLLGYFLVSAGRRLEFKRAAWALGALLIIIFSLLTIQRQAVWSSDLTLWRDAVIKSPYHSLPYTNYGLALSNVGEYEEAIRHYKIALLPDMKDSPRGKSVTANNLGLLYIEKEEYPRAEGWFYKALEFDPSNGRTYYHLGLINFVKGELGGPEQSYEAAESYLREALTRYYHFGKANLLLAKIYLRAGDTEKAKEEAEIAIKSGLTPELLDQAREILKVNN